MKGTKHPIDADLSVPQADVTRQTLLNASLFRAVEALDANEILALLEEGADVNATRPTESGSKTTLATPLSLAVELRQTRVMMVLIRNGADVNVRTSNGFPLLSALASSNGGDPGGRLNVVREMVRQGADLNAACEQLRTSVHHAVITQDLQLLDCLVAAGARLDVRDDSGSTPLHLACARGFYDGALLLLRHGADPNARCKLGNRPLHDLMRDDNPFTSSDEDVTGSVATLKALVDAGAIINARNVSGSTPLMLASQMNNGSEEVLLELLERGATFDPDSGQVESAMTHAINNDFADFLSHLRSLGEIDVRAHRYADGQTLLHQAVQVNALSCAARLLEWGCDPAIRDLHDHDCFHGASQECQQLMQAHQARNVALQALDSAMPSKSLKRPSKRLPQTIS